MRWTIVLVLIIFSCSFSYSQVYVNSIAVGANDGSSWNDAFTDIQSGINAADASPTETEVWVAAGTYLQGAQINLRDNVQVYGGFPNVGNPVLGE